MMSSGLAADWKRNYIYSNLIIIVSNIGFSFCLATIRFASIYSFMIEIEKRMLRVSVSVWPWSSFIYKLNSITRTINIQH